MREWILGKEVIKPKDMFEMSREELLTLTKQHLYSTYSIHEVDEIFPAARALINELKIDDPEFDRKYDAIMIGAYVLARVICQWHEGAGTAYYDKSFKELADMFGVKSVAMMGGSASDPGFRKLITCIGEKVLDGTLPFKAEYLNNIPLATKYIPLLQRLNIYRPEIVADDDEELTMREFKLIRKIESHQQTIHTLRQELEAAKTNIAELAPKAFLHDEAEKRRLAEEEEKNQKVKGRFGHFGRKK